MKVLTGHVPNGVYPVLVGCKFTLISGPDSGSMRAFKNLREYIVIGFSIQPYIQIYRPFKSVEALAMKLVYGSAECISNNAKGTEFDFKARKVSTTLKSAYNRAAQFDTSGHAALYPPVLLKLGEHVRLDNMALPGSVRAKAAGSVF